MRTALVTDYEAYLFGEGRWLRAWEKMGARPAEVGGSAGYSFVVWAPNAREVSVVGTFNGWDARHHPMRPVGSSGVWETFVPGLGEGALYKFAIQPRHGPPFAKADPFALFAERPPETASVTHHVGRHVWRDDAWMTTRRERGTALDRPMAIYEVHTGSWRRKPEDGFRPLTWRELASELVPYATHLGFTHLELLPVMEHPFEGSWGYQVTGFFAPTSRHGTPDDFRYFVDECHAHGLGVILDWVPGHFPKDAHGLAMFDGTALFEHADPRQGEHRDWGTLIFNYGRHEVRNFLLSNALYWLESFHVDGVRVDAVASMLYLDYSRGDDWLPNRYGGRENLEAIDFLRELNQLTHEHFPGTVTIAEESTAFPAVSRPTWVGGLGFTFKWNMGWMHDILAYVGKDPIYRRWEHQHLTFSMLYAWNENFILPFSHDEVVHGKGAMMMKAPGDAWQKAATLRALYTFMYVHPGKKLLFMGSEIGQWREWNHDASIDWHLLDGPLHAGLQLFVADVNRRYRAEAALHELDFEPRGFEWIDCNDHESSVVALIRRARDPDDWLVAVLNWTPIIRRGYRIGVPASGFYRELVNSDAGVYGGSNVGNGGGSATEAIPAHGHPYSLNLTLPPLGALILKLDTGTITVR
ncbi:MAG TPA: 1,4-alpha-glucan branching protein GlgB [Vicinamibacterales bacterium]|nr:1,4-alpha-glucan branching protein GlgB [Vicinamibacterales bacterium]